MGSHPEFEQFCPRHSPQDKLQSSPCFLQVQRLLSQLLLQLQRIIDKSLCGAGWFFIMIGIILPFEISHPNSDGFNVPSPT